MNFTRSALPRQVGETVAGKMELDKYLRVSLADFSWLDQGNYS
ncbi:MAG TPA: hypothetical protein VIW72_10315 [Burkholderiales bacterium]